MPEKKEVGTELGLAGFILGVLSIIFIGNNGVIIAIVGFIFSMVQHKRRPTRFSKLGIILNIIGFILAIIFIILLLTYLSPLLQQQGFPIA
jgi:hypothetical protein